LKLPEKSKGIPKRPIIGILNKDVIRILRKFKGNNNVIDNIMNLLGFSSLKLFVVFIL